MRLRRKRWSEGRSGGERTDLRGERGKGRLEEIDEEKGMDGGTEVGWTEARRKSEEGREEKGDGKVN